MLTDQELLRYSRQILLQHVDIDGQLRLKNGRALIVGLGGLGAPVALYLAAAVAQVDVVLDCSDNFSTREAVNAACVGAAKPLISGAAIRLEGQLSVFDPRRADSPCYHCLYGHGSDAELTCSEAGVVGPLVGLVGSLQALEALKLLAGFGEPLVGRLLLIDALTTRFRELRVKRDPGCSVCGTRHG